MDIPRYKTQFQLQELASQDTLQLLEKDVCEGLLQAPRSLPPKYFYDETGSKLFEAICKAEDYYPTRTEYALLKKHATEIVNTVKPQTCIELGAGASTKTELLISEICKRSDDFLYVTIDVCREVLVESADRLLQLYPNLQVQSLVGEYIPGINALNRINEPSLYIFLGSSIGNFPHSQAVELLSHIARRMQPNDYFLLGLDRVKDTVVLEQAYDDTEGITAKFNLNVLNVLNNKLGSNFDLEQFTHQAIYNEDDQQIEMYLISKQNQQVLFPTLDKTIQLQTGERILTEISRKYTQATIKKLLSESGLMEKKHFLPENEFFSLVLTKRRS